MDASILFFILVLACPLGMWFMMRGGHGHAHHGDGQAVSIEDLRLRRDELDREILAREGR